MTRIRLAASVVVHHRPSTFHFGLEVEIRFWEGSKVPFLSVDVPPPRPQLGPPSINPHGLRPCGQASYAESS